jgi:flagellar basal body rod protein FlgG
MNSVQALGTAEKRLESIAANLANLSVNGFKRSNVSTRSFQSVLNGEMRTSVTSKRSTDFSQGELRTTGEPLDVALHGPGFFAVESPTGEVYTRDGRFFLDDKGVLQTMEGLPVAWEGSRGTLDPVGAPATIDEEGNVRQGEQAVGRLRVVDFDRTDLLTTDRRGFFRAPPTLQPSASTATVRHGQLEQSNANAIDELVALIAVQRQFESGTRLMSTIDQTYRRLTSPR